MIPYQMNNLASILLVDDDKINNYINERLIRKTGLSHNITIRNNGEEGIFYLEKECIPNNKFPTLILLDINMPVINGIEFVELLISNYSLVLNYSKLCILSTSENATDIQKIKEFGDFLYVSKPLTQSKLIDIYNFYFKKKD